MATSPATKQYHHPEKPEIIHQFSLSHFRGHFIPVELHPFFSYGRSFDPSQSRNCIFSELFPRPSSTTTIETRFPALLGKHKNGYRCTFSNIYRSQMRVGPCKNWCAELYLFMEPLFGLRSVGKLSDTRVQSCSPCFPCSTFTFQTLDCRQNNREDT